MHKDYPWLTRPINNNQNVSYTRSVLNDIGINTVCDSACCPNIHECFSQKTATFLILGRICTRKCGFCSVVKGLPQQPDKDEPKKIAEAVKKLELNYVVITSVTRDDLPDGGSAHFKKVVEAIRTLCPDIGIELLVPDFNNNVKSIDEIVSIAPDVIAHNIETVGRLYPLVRGKADYRRSLKVLEYFKKTGKLLVKSGLMLGLGESSDEVLTTLYDLKTIGCDIITIGQYLRPTKENIEVAEFIHPDKFAWYKKQAEDIGFRNVVAGPFVRSSYHADIMLQDEKCKI